MKKNLNKINLVRIIIHLREQEDQEIRDSRYEGSCNPVRDETGLVILHLSRLTAC